MQLPRQDGEDRAPVEPRPAGAETAPAQRARWSSASCTTSSRSRRLDLIDEPGGRPGEAPASTSPKFTRTANSCGDLSAAVAQLPSRAGSTPPMNRFRDGRAGTRRKKTRPAAMSGISVSSVSWPSLAQIARLKLAGSGASGVARTGPAYAVIGLSVTE